jgi:hypothetical protein
MHPAGFYWAPSLGAGGPGHFAFAFGAGAMGRLGYGEDKDSAAPVAAAAATPGGGRDAGFVAVAAGRDHTLLVTGAGAVCLRAPPCSSPCMQCWLRRPLAVCRPWVCA